MQYHRGIRLAHGMIESHPAVERSHVRLIPTCFIVHMCWETAGNEAVRP